MKIIDKISRKLRLINKAESLGRALEGADDAGRKRIFSHSKAGDIDAGYLGIALSSVRSGGLVVNNISAEGINFILKHPNAVGISAEHLGEALKYADAEGINLILNHPNAGDIRAEQLGRALSNADAERIKLILQYPNAGGINTWCLGKALRNADAEGIQRIFSHSNTGSIGARYLDEALSYADAEGINLILNHPNAVGIKAEQLGRALRYADAEGTTRILNHPNANAISLDAFAGALKGDDAKKNAHIIAYLHIRNIAPEKVTSALASVIIKAAVISGDMALWDKVIPKEHRTAAHLRDFLIYNAIYAKAINTEFPPNISEKKDALQAAGVSNNLAELLAYMLQKERETPGAFDVSTMPPHVKEDVLLHAVLEQQLPVFNAAMQPEISHNISTKFIHALSETLAPLIILNQLSNSIAPFAEEMTHSLMKHPNCQLRHNPIVALAHPKTQVLGVSRIGSIARGLQPGNGINSRH